MPKIRTVFQPDLVQDADEAEAAQLQRDGLLLPLEPETAAPKPAATVTAPAAPKEAPADGSK